MADETRKVDNIDIPFVNDERVLGTWEYANIVKTIDEFQPDIPLSNEAPNIPKLEFLPNGEMKILNELNEIEQTAFTWTNGFILNPVDQTCSAYTISEINGITYLFFEWKSGDYTFRMMEPWFYVMKKI
jgi:bla regulator protein BlaR1